MPPKHQHPCQDYILTEQDMHNMALLLGMVECANVRHTTLITVSQAVSLIIQQVSSN